MKKLLLLLLLSLGFIGSANAEINTISDVFQIIWGFWDAIKSFFALPGTLVLILFYDTSIGHFFELSRYAETISLIINLVYWCGGFIFMLSSTEYLDKLTKTTGKKIFEKISSQLFWVWLFIPAFIGFIVHTINPQLLHQIFF
jgi:hypothetical protein